MASKHRNNKQAAAKTRDSDVTESKQRPQNKHLVKFKPGVSGNPAGRPVGSRTKLAEAFLKDFLEDWEANGVAALAKCRVVDPARYCSIAASLIPKELNIKEGESILDKLLEQFSVEQLDVILGFIAGGGTVVPTQSIEHQNKKASRTKSNGLH